MAGQCTTRSDLERILFDETAEPVPLPFSLLREITGGFSPEQIIGTGGFATVYKGKLGNGMVAVKNLHNTHLHEKEFLREVECLMMARHENVVRFLGYCSDTQGTMEMYEGKLVMAEERQRLLCFEYVPKGDLHEYIDDASCGLDWTHRYRIIKGIVEGLHYLHQKHIVHLDLKPTNILLDHNMMPKIADFGLSRYFHEQQSKLIASKIGGTSGYLAPEFDNHLITRKYDLYSLGVIITEILTGKKGYHAVENVLESWRNRLDMSLSDTQFDQVRECAEIGIECYQTNASVRPTTKQIIDRLNKMENMDESMKIGLTRSSKQQTETASSELHHGTLPLMKEKSSDSLATPSKNAGWGPPLYVVIVYAFDCTTSTPAWYTMDGVYWLVHEKLTHLVNSYLGYIYVMSTPNTYRSEMKLVDSAETESTGYSASSRWQKTACTKKMASGLYEAHELIGNSNGVILLFSDGLINKGDFFNGTEEFVSKVPVHTFTLGSDAYNHGLGAIAQNSPGGTFNPDPVPEKAKRSTPFSHLLDTILSCTVKYYEKHPCLNSGPGRRPLGVFIVYAFDCTTSSPAWNKTNDVYWMVNEKLTHRVDRIGFVYVMSTPNTYRSDMKFVDSAETGNYKGSLAYRDTTCDKNMASGLYEADRLTRDHANQNSIVLLFSDGLINKGDFFDGAEDFVSKVPVHTFTLYGDAYNHGLRAIAANSPGGTFNSVPVPDNPKLSAPFSQLLDRIISGSM